VPRKICGLVGLNKFKKELMRLVVGDENKSSENKCKTID